MLGLKIVKWQRNTVPVVYISPVPALLRALAVLPAPGSARGEELDVQEVVAAKSAAQLLDHSPEQRL